MTGLFFPKWKKCDFDFCRPWIWGRGEGNEKKHTKEKSKKKTHPQTRVLIYIHIFIYMKNVPYFSSCYRSSRHDDDVNCYSSWPIFGQASRRWSKDVWSATIVIASPMQFRRLSKRTYSVLTVPILDEFALPILLSVLISTLVNTVYSMKLFQNR